MACSTQPRKSLVVSVSYPVVRTDITIIRHMLVNRKLDFSFLAPMLICIIACLKNHVTSLSLNDFSTREFFWNVLLRDYSHEYVVNDN